MKKWFPWIVLAIFAAWFLGSAKAPAPKNGFDLAGFGRLPVLLNGRVQPMDSVARNALLSMQGKSTIRVAGKTLSATEWLLEAMSNPDLADQRKIFRVQHPDLEGLLGAQKPGLEYYSFNDLTNQLASLESQAQTLIRSEKDREDAAKNRTAFQKDLMHLYSSASLYREIKNSLHPDDTTNFVEELNVFQSALGPALAEVKKQGAGQEYDKVTLARLAPFFQRYQELSTLAYPLAVPPSAAETQEGWKNVGTSLMEALRTEKVHPAVTYFATMTTAYAANNPSEFNQALATYRGWLQSNSQLPALEKSGREFFFNQLEPFYKAMVIYVAALILGCIFWINTSEPVRRAGFMLLALAFVIHTIGLGFRMYLEGRPPVTNLYSSAIFIGWGSVFLGLILERMFKGGIGLVSSALIGFITLIIAHHLSLSGDTMEMLRAVLDTNLWLATHVVTVTIGYASMFVAGLLAVIYILGGFFTPRISQPVTAAAAKKLPIAAGMVSPALGVASAIALNKSTGDTMGKALARMVYGIVCFSILFSFAGTVLGGIWADQSWGRFWGWDPKENGALLIVIWNAIILHARWAGMIKDRGLMCMAVFGNIVTSFSWFGVNMLGVGLHSYGFMDKAFPWLVAFVVSQIAIIIIGSLPPRMWASFRNAQSPEAQGEPVVS